MKTLLGTLLALGLFSGTANAWYCPPGYGYGYSASYSYGHSYHKPTYHSERVVVVKPAVEVAPAPVAPAAPEAPAEPTPAPAAPEAPK